MVKIWSCGHCGQAYYAKDRVRTNDTCPYCKFGVIRQVAGKGTKISLEQ